MPVFDLEFWSRVFSIVLIDLILSGDNAVVIGMAARRLSPENRRRAIIFGGAGAVGLRVLFTIIASQLLGIPYLQTVGGVLLIWIAYKLLRPEPEGHHLTEAGSLRQAVQTIILADVVMSLDNVLAVGGAARGHVGLLIFGLLLSIPLLLLGSELVARLLGRYPALLYVGVLVLLFTATQMILEDTLVHQFYNATQAGALIVTAIIAGIIIFLARRIPPVKGKPPKSPATGADTGDQEPGAVV